MAGGQPGGGSLSYKLGDVMVQSNEATFFPVGDIAGFEINKTGGNVCQG